MAGLSISCWQMLLSFPCFSEVCFPLPQGQCCGLDLLQDGFSKQTLSREVGLSVLSLLALWF